MLNFLIPSSIPVPDANTLQLISIASLIVGICLVLAGGAFLLWGKKAGGGWKVVLGWVLAAIGATLTLGHAVQLMLY